MGTFWKILFFFVLPAAAPLIYPPEMLLPNLPIIGLVLVMFMTLGYFLWKGYALALTLSIFLQGFNVIIRLMMLFPNVMSAAGQFYPVYLVAALASIALSFYLLMRLDKTDVRVQMIRG
jgi:hypothetical protein